MYKEVRFTGYTAVPSDYDCPDGQLAQSFNLLNETGSMQPIFPPRKLFPLQANERVLLIHAVADQKNLILMRPKLTSDNGFDLYWLPYDPSTENTENARTVGTANTYNGFRDLTALGHTLILSTDKGLQYILWKDDGYITLGNRPPFISIDFGMLRLGTLTESGDYDIPASCAFGWSGTRGEAEKSELASMTQMAYGLLYSAIAEKVTSKGLFYQPFFIRYAYRLYDGSYNWHSAPILMLPSVLPPIIKYTDGGSNTGDNVKATFTLDVNYFALTYRIITDCADSLAAWDDIVAGIDIFISSPIYTYDQSKNLEFRPVTTLRNFLLSAGGFEGSGFRPGISGSLVPAPDEILSGHYADTSTAPYKDHFLTLDASEKVLDIKLHEHFHDNIRNTNLFYKVASFDIKDLKKKMDFERLELKGSDLSSLPTLPFLPDDYLSHDLISPRCLYAFNSRLNMACVDLSPATPFPIRSVMQYGGDPKETSCHISITVWTRRNGVRCHSFRAADMNEESDKLFDPSANFPRYVFYPDPSAYRMQFRFSDGRKVAIDLKSHDFLNGAYYYNDDFTITIPSGLLTETVMASASVRLGSKIYTSEVNNPFFFPATGINTVGTGRILGICSAAKALSQGQFGQFPLYAFTDEGVWALEVSSSGGFSAKQPITRDVCRSADSITQIDSAVLFATDRGIMLISGSQTQCISDVLNSPDYFDLAGLPGLCAKFPEFRHPDCLFIDYIKNCRMAYDYVNQRIILFNPDKGYAYVYSMKTKLWGIQECSLTSVINSYPDALAMAKGEEENYLVDLSHTDAETVRCLLVSRPLKFDSPEVLKTLTTTIQRGMLPRHSEDMATILYGTRDYISWHLIGSSCGLSLRSFRGTPYKAFRIVTVATMRKGNTIAGCSFDLTPRMTNRLR